MESIRKAYRRLVSPDVRHWFYMYRNLSDYRALRHRAFESPKGTFSLRRYTESKCIFVHVTKAAGTSIALSLFGELPYHYTARQYRVIYGRRDFRDFFKFTFVRNPWDRLFSAWTYLSAGGWDDKDRQWVDKNLGGVSSFEEFVLDWISAERLKSHMHFWPQSDFVCDRKGKPMVDYLGYFETVRDDFETIARRLGKEAELMHTNKSGRASYESAYDGAMIERVATLYEKDIARFGYSYDGLQRRAIVDGVIVDA